MGLTITEKILLRHSGDKEIYPGKFILAEVDFAFGNDITAPLAIKALEEIGIKKVFNPKRIALIPDHFTPAKDLSSARQAKILADFARKYKIKHYYEVGKMGIEHALLPELGLINPGDLVIGADSHTCTLGALGAFATGVGSTDLAGAMAIGKVWLKVPETIKFVYYGKLHKWLTAKDVILYTLGDIGVEGALYKAMEFTGETISKLDMDGRFTLCNMAIEAGGKTGIIEPDEITLNYIQRNQKSEIKNLKSDKDAEYAGIKEYDVRNWKEPAVACPDLPSNVKPVSELKEIKIHQVVIGSCTNGRISDLRASAKILKGKRIHPEVRMIVIPATQSIYLQAVREGLAEIFVKAGAVFSTPTCGPCLGGHMGILDKGEKCISTTNRNFRGRMGHPESEVYLASPLVASASAIKGRIAHPGEVSA
ncbi:MAG: 3-isopropylmalate dehydratase large subunit [Candidatus Omnitrophica bacterium]|nr:3-isopropylmalate dehydratase large subunit [Candidatus Omnitrophota bacterium]MCM8792897.1 3-isopropylmalate dehydratase large subunit [Candidatus Omnitrophota bacterium]